MTSFKKEGNFSSFEKLYLIYKYLNLSGEPTLRPFHGQTAPQGVRRVCTRTILIQCIYKLRGKVFSTVTSKASLSLSKNATSVRKA